MLQYLRIAILTILCSIARSYDVDVRNMEAQPFGVTGSCPMAGRWVPQPIPDEIAFAAIKAGVDSMPPGVKMFLNSGELFVYTVKRIISECF